MIKSITMRNVASNSFLVKKSIKKNPIRIFQFIKYVTCPCLLISSFDYALSQYQFIYLVYTEVKTKSASKKFSDYNKKNFK